MAEDKITTAPNGPYLVEGPVQIVDPTGNVVETNNRPRIALCRCGGSAKKPFCDGTHGRIGFKADESAPNA